MCGQYGRLISSKSHNSVVYTVYSGYYNNRSTWCRSSRSYGILCCNCHRYERRSKSQNISRVFSQVAKLRRQAQHLDLLRWPIRLLYIHTTLLVVIISILDHRNGQICTSANFFVKWLNYPDSANSWEPYSSLRDVIVLHDYLKLKKWTR